MKSTLLAAPLVVFVAGAAFAQTVPNPANPFPEHPISTDGSPLALDHGFATRTPASRDFQALYEGDASDVAATRR